MLENARKSTNFGLAGMDGKRCGVGATALGGCPGHALWPRGGGGTKNWVFDFWAPMARGAPGRYEQKRGFLCFLAVFGGF